MKTPPSPLPNRIRFEDMEVDLRTEELFRSGRRIRVPQQSFRVLTVLLEHAGDLVTREELRARLWPAGTFVEYDQGLNAAIKRLREALHDSAEVPRFIETLPKRGYRFIAATQPVESPPHVAAPTAPNGLAHVEPATTPPVKDTAAAEAVSAPAVPAPAPDASRLDRRVLIAAGAGLTAIVAIAIVFWVIANRSAPGVPAGRQVVPFTSLPGQELAPTFSPDGSQIAFAWNGDAGAGQQFDLYVKSLGSERLLRLTHRPAKSIAPAWSPDGRTIAFARVAGDVSGLYTIPAIGGAERTLVSTGISVGSFRQISWSPDGQRIAYSAYGPQGAPQVYFVAVDSLTAEPLSPAPQPECLDAGEPAFSPDGKQLAFICISSPGVYSIFVTKLPSGPPRRLASQQGDPQGLTWSRDGTRLIFSNNGGDGGELWQLTLDGVLSQLPFGENSSGPAIARSGSLAYVRGRNTINIWRADLTAEHPEEGATKLIYSTVIQVVPRYSLDGKRIVFQSNRSGTMEIWTADADGGDPDRLTSFGGPVTASASWCSDGRRIAFDSRAAGASGIYIEDVAKRVPHKVVTSEANLLSPVWSQDCRWLFAHASSHALYRFPSSGGPAQRFTNRPSSYSTVVADRVIFNVMDESGVTVWTKPTRGGREERLENLPRVRYDDAWAATVAGIYYTDSSSMPVRVNFYDFATKTTRTLMTLKQTPVPGAGPAIAVSPDGHWLLYSQVDDEQSDIMLAHEQ